MVAQFNPSKPHCSKCGAVPNVPCQMPKPPARIRPNRRIVISSCLGLLQPHKPKPANRLSRIRPNRGLAEYLLGRLRAMSITSYKRVTVSLAIGIILLLGLVWQLNLKLHMALLDTKASEQSTWVEVRDIDKCRDWALHAELPKAVEYLDMLDQ